MVACLEQEGVGLVSSLIAGTGGDTLGDALEATQLSGFVAPAVVTTALAGRAITIGKSLAMRRADLDDLGGWGAVGDVLAEDDVLGQLFRAAGFRVEVCLVPIENPNVGSSVRRTLERHARWAKMRRAIEPLAYVAEPLLSPGAMALMAFALHPCARTAKAWVLCCILQAFMATLSMRALRGDWPRWTTPLLEIVRIHLLFGCWLWGLVSSRVSWRGNDFRVTAGSRLVPVKARGTLLPAASDTPAAG
jgi:ceramide glucosyltransferase